MLIPKLIHQTFPNYDSLNSSLRDNIHFLKDNNPDWIHNFYSDHDVEDFIRTSFGKDYIGVYLKIDPRYGAARADFFRYLVIYKYGGLYLDIKSTALKPLDDIIKPDDRFLVSTWPNSIDGVDTSLMGYHKKLSFREYQNWFICSEPNSSVLEKVIERVVQNLNQYRALTNGVGMTGVLCTTGPIPYSQSVRPFVLNGFVRVSSNEELGFKYTIFQFGNNEHHNISGKHYGILKFPIVSNSKLDNYISPIFFGLHQLCIRAFRKIRSLV
jgi:mannosyltransferase OCH1-like enzyme